MTISNITYTITGIPFGTVAISEMIYIDGKKIGSAEFEALPQADKQALSIAVQRYIARLGAN